MKKKCKYLIVFTCFITLGVSSTRAQTITTIAGIGVAGFSGDGGPAASAELNRPVLVYPYVHGSLCFWDFLNTRVRKIAADGTISTIAGTGVTGPYPGDGSPATSLSLPLETSIAVDGIGNIYVSTQDYLNYYIRKIDTFGIVTTIAGVGTFGSSGDGGPATAAQISASRMTIDRHGNIYFADGSARIRKIDTMGIITNIAGNGTPGHTGDGGPATAASISPHGLAVDYFGNLYMCTVYHVRKIDTAGVITTIAGNGSVGFSGDGGPATAASFYGPNWPLVDGLGNLYISDQLNNCVRRINSAGIITTIAGMGGMGGYAGDGGPATAALFDAVNNVARLADGTMYVTDVLNHRIRKISNSGNRVPAFAGGALQAFEMCHDATYDISGLLPATDADVGQPLSWVLVEHPAHGTVTAPGSMTSTGGLVSPGSATYVPDPGYVGTDTFVVRVDDTVSVDYTTICVQVCTLPESAGVWGKDTLCVGDTAFFYSTLRDGTWSSSDGAVATIGSDGLVTAVSAGVGVISYSFTNVCGTLHAPRAVTIVSPEDCATGLDNSPIRQASIDIFPNPATGAFTIAVSGGNRSEQVAVSMTDLLGRQVWHATLSSNRRIVCRERLAPGIYCITTTGAVHSRQLLVVR